MANDIAQLRSTVSNAHCVVNSVLALLDDLMEVQDKIEVQRRVWAISKLLEPVDADLEKVEVSLMALPADVAGGLT